jgi:hypothetical protein
MATRADSEDRQILQIRNAQQALTMRDCTPGMQDADYQRELQQLAIALHNRGELAEAEPLFRRLVVLQRGGVCIDPTNDHVYHLAMTLDDLADSADGQQKSDLLAESSELYRESFRGRINAGETDAPDTVLISFKLARVLIRRDKLAEAEAILRAAKAQCDAGILSGRREVAMIHEHHMHCISKLAVKYFHAGKFEQSEVFLREVLEQKRMIHGNNGAEQLLVALENLCMCLLQQQKHAAAEPLLQERLVILTQAKGDGHEDTQKTVEELIDALAKQQKHAAVEQLREDQLALRQRLHGAEDRRTLGVHQRLALARMAAGRLAEAEEMIERLLPVQRRVLGKNHEEVGVSNATLAKIRKRLKDSPGATTTAHESSEEAQARADAAAEALLAMLEAEAPESANAARTKGGAKKNADPKGKPLKSVPIASAPTAPLAPESGGTSESAPPSKKKAAAVAKAKKAAEEAAVGKKAAEEAALGKKAAEEAAIGKKAAEEATELLTAADETAANGTKKRGSRSNRGKAKNAPPAPLEALATSDGQPVSRAACNSEPVAEPRRPELAGGSRTLAAPLAYATEQAASAAHSAPHACRADVQHDSAVELAPAAAADGCADSCCVRRSTRLAAVPSARSAEAEAEADRHMEGWAHAIGEVRALFPELGVGFVHVRNPGRRPYGYEVQSEYSTGTLDT